MTSSFTTNITVAEPAEKVYNAINNVGGWWQGEITGPTKKPGDIFEYRMKEFHYSKQQIVEMVPFKKIVWNVTDSQLNFIEQKAEWKGTQIIFDINELQSATEIIFTHVGLIPPIECYKSCSNGWTKLIHQSLYSLITTGKGTNVF